jgi:hypothetical protein
MLKLSPEELDKIIHHHYCLLNIVFQAPADTVNQKDGTEDINSRGYNYPKEFTNQ